MLELMLTAVQPSIPIEFRLIPTADFITNVNFCTALGITSGTVRTTAINWMEWHNPITDETIIIPQSQIRYSVRPSELIVQVPFDRSKTITINGNTYTVGLMRGSTTAILPSNDNPPDPGGEWDKYMYSVSSLRPANWNGRKFAEFTATELGLWTNGGERTICMEYDLRTPIANRTFCTRGNTNSVVSSGRIGNGDNNPFNGFRPILTKVLT